MSARVSSAVCQDDHCGNAEDSQQWTGHGACADHAYCQESVRECLADSA